jgi:hypothetical protein
MRQTLVSSWIDRPNIGIDSATASVAALEAVGPQRAFVRIIRVVKDGTSVIADFP